MASPLSADSSAVFLSRRPERLEILALALLLLAPLQVSGPIRGGSSSLDLVPPRVYSGDEPHYLVQINSLLNDGDLDLANNYAAVPAGGTDAGQRFAGSALDHHVSWYVDGRHVYWSDVYETNPSRWTPDRSGALAPTPRADAAVEPPDGPEYSMHPPGLAFLLAPLLYPFRGTVWVESVAIFCSGLAVVLSLVFFRSLVRPFLARDRDFLLVAAVAFLGTPVWHYGRTLFTEPYLLLCAVGAYALHLRHGMHFLAGVFVAVGVLLKAPFGILAVPLAIDLLVRRQWSSLFRFGLPCAGALLVLAGLNQHMYGSWERMSQRWTWENPLVGALGLLLSVEHGLLLFAPAAIAAAAAWPGLLRTRRRESLILLSAVGLHFALLACYHFWWGGSCYGPRYLVPVLPLFFAATPVPLIATNTAAEASRRTVLALYAVSILINVAGAFLAGHAWDVHPFGALLRFI